MRRLMPVLLAVVLSVTSLHAEAKRMGGGKSFGRQSSNVTQQQSTPTAPGQPGAGMQQTQPGRTANQTAPAQTAPQRKPWAGILGGLAAGLGLAWLANALGFGEGFANMLMILLLVMGGLMLFRMVRRSSSAPAARGPVPAYQGGAAAPQSYNPKNVGNDASARPWESQGSQGVAFQAEQAAGGSMIGSGLSGSQNWGIPAGFDVQGFLDAAKRNFVTLQDAWDRGDVSSLRAMMTDEMLGEIRQQLAEREAEAGGKANKTEVEMLQAQLLGIEETPTDYLASVEFSGMVKEDESAGPSPFHEVWNMSKSKTGGAGWLVAGVQAMQVSGVQATH